MPAVAPGEPCFPIDERFYPLDFTEFVLKNKTELSTEFARLYQQGHSIKEIADHYGCSKNKVRSLLIDIGLTLRERHAQATHQRSITSGKQGARPYYGFCYFEGRIVKDPHEFPTLEMIHRRWTQKRSAHSIVIELNRKKIPSREGKQWSWAAVRNILERFETEKIVLKGREYEFR